jgi:NAD(P)-dependent dehydrogenase (short-subunit alcohol dehydrogenase family)
MFDLSGQVALLTGAGRGIGLAMAQALAAAGCSIALQDIELDVAQQEADAINNAGGRAVAFGGDIRDLTLPDKLISEVIEKFGRLDILVNNAAIQDPKHWTTNTLDELREQLDADLISPILFIKRALPVFKEQHYGRIVNLGSIQQRAVNPGMFPYSLSKGGLEKVTRGLCRELASSNITINLIAPGWIASTHRNRESLSSPELVEKYGKERVPIGRLGHPNDFRGIVLLLCSPAGSYITGQTIFIDGGLSA